MSETTLSQAAYARARGVDQSAINKLVHAGRIPLVNGKIDPKIADEHWFNGREKRLAKAADAEESDARRVRAAIDAATAKLKMTKKRTEQMQARSASRTAVQAQIRTVIQGLAARVAALAGDDPLLAAAVEMMQAELGDIELEGRRVTAP